MRDAPENLWLHFWEEGRPKGEGACRDLLMALMERRVSQVVLEREASMPAEKRADIVARCGKVIVPLEVKAQWNPDLWKAPQDQLQVLYARDYRAGGAGVYVVFWFGEDQRLPAPPGNGARPSNAQQLRNMLVEMHGENECFACFVLDVSRDPFLKESREKFRKGKAGKGGSGRMRGERKDEKQGRRAPPRSAVDEA